MNEKTARVINGWLSLTSDERMEFQNAMDEYSDATESRRLQIQESMRKSAMETSPLGWVCPCCGK